MIDKLDHMKNLDELVRVLNKVDNITLLTTHDVCTEFVKTLTNYFLVTTHELLYSINKVVNSIELK